jgi:hypothetical protein
MANSKAVDADRASGGRRGKPGAMSVRAAPMDDSQRIDAVKDYPH